MKYGSNSWSLKHLYIRYFPVGYTRGDLREDLYSSDVLLNHADFLNYWKSTNLVVYFHNEFLIKLAVYKSVRPSSWINKFELHSQCSMGI